MSILLLINVNSRGTSLKQKYASHTLATKIIKKIFQLLFVSVMNE